MNIKDKIQNVKSEINNYAATIDMMKYVNARMGQMVRIDPNHQDNILYNYILPCIDLDIDIVTFISMNQDDYAKERIMIHNTTDNINYDLISYNQYMQGVEEEFDIDENGNIYSTTDEEENSHRHATVLLRYTNTSSYILLSINKKIDDIQTMNIISKFTNPYIYTIYNRSYIGKIRNSWALNDRSLNGIIDNFYKWFKACMLCYDDSFETFMYDISKYLLETYRIVDSRQYDISNFGDVFSCDCNFNPVNVDTADIVLTYMAYNYNDSQLINDNQLTFNQRYLVNNSKILNFPGLFGEDE